MIATPFLPLALQIFCCCALLCFANRRFAQRVCTEDLHRRFAQKICKARGRKICTSDLQALDLLCKSLICKATRFALGPILQENRLFAQFRVWPLLPLFVRKKGEGSVFDSVKNNGTGGDCKENFLFSSFFIKKK